MKITTKWALVSENKMATKASLNLKSLQKNTIIINMPTIAVYLIGRNILAFNFPYVL